MASNWHDSELGGTPFETPQYAGTAAGPGSPVKQPPSSGLAVTSMVLGIVAIPSTCCCWLLAVPLGIAAIITGFIALGKIRTGMAEGKGMATAGLICGIVAVVLSIGLFILALFLDMPDIMQEIRQMQIQ